MKTALSTLCLILFLVGFSIPTHQPNSTKNVKTTEVTASKLRHVVLFKFKETSTEADIKKVEEAFNALPSKIDLIKDYEWGLNNSPEGLNKGLTHCYFLTFDSEADRDAYLPHPDHQAFGAVAGPHIADVLVVDYWTK
ncbi:Dabb family protein [Flagellimonas zhangzhouensis]|uniref:Stress responsive A/B Barrel Domain n=1 Tax=Flagellimonas zhangzhouensis TaxID=1073328 RepID=A0A1H2X728_9FLAO|nr:Dabb family protein [Allomuricauda zhangzhouensis]SDQ28254.1 Stress responsive A/B Barrel Domain [Allomuricauda zhangzhouensis]SDW88069.1 Stress responsive A/B Barrel Domain [Allomuricauda zhangzhouensis]